MTEWLNWTEYTLYITVNITIIKKRYSIISLGEHSRMFEMKIVSEILGGFDIVYMLFKWLTIDLIQKVSIW